MYRNWHTFRTAAPFAFLILALSACGTSKAGKSECTKGSTPHTIQAIDTRQPAEAEYPESYITLEDKSEWWTVDECRHWAVGDQVRVITAEDCEVMIESINRQDKFGRPESIEAVRQ